ncbi:MAG: DNA (cytosine-5-)-methyltransferase, partial [Candidatus Woesearchaeota archaeon]|nr:DNA (cytosine-5-)-methyltransferase [Candidatus Woesearchaeota archaeon]
MPDEEEIRLAESLARKRAYDLHHQAYSIRLNYQQDHQTFFTGEICTISQATRKLAAPLITTGGGCMRKESFLVGTDCSGMEAPIQAVDNLQVKYQHTFSSDNDPMVQATIRANFKPCQIDGDITVRNVSQCPYVDVYVAGFPCQPFSTAGKQQGFADDKGRGTICYYILEYIRTHKPKVFILENVKGLVTLQKGKYLRTILKALSSICTDGSAAYEIHHEVLNTREHGIPQNRPRWYCVGIRKDTFQSHFGSGADKSSFEFPKPIMCPSIELFLDGERSHPEQPAMKVSNAAQANIDHANRKIREEQGNPDIHPYVVDCDASRAKSRHMYDISPCITRSRYQGHWITNRKRRMNKAEMLRLQGMNPGKFVSVVSDQVLGQQIGNAMSVNVIERILKRALEAANLVDPGSLEDHWANGDIHSALKLCKEATFTHSSNKPSNVPKERIVRQIMSSNRTIRILIVDSGASFHLIDWSSLTDQEKSNRRDLEEAILLNTANGPVWATECTDIYVIELGITVEAVILEKSPAVLSLGKLVEDEGFDYVWKHAQVPYLQTSEEFGGGPPIYCYPHTDVPFITNSVQADATPGSGGSSDPPQAQPEASRVEGPNPIEGEGNLKPEEEQRATSSERTKEKRLAEQSLKAKQKRKSKKKSRTCSTCEHNPFTHFPRDPNCWICNQCKVHRAYLKPKSGPAPDGLPEPKEFGDAITSDHKIINEDDESRDHDKIAQVTQDKATSWLQSYASETKATAEVKKAFQRFLGPDGKVKHVYTDNSKEFAKALDELGFSHDTSTPHRPETNGIAESAVKKVKEGTACSITQSGFTEDWWVYAMNCFCFLRCIIDKLAKGGRTAYYLRFGIDFQGTAIPFGAEIRYYPITQKDKARLHGMGERRLQGIFVGYVQHAGGGWSGDLEIVDWEELDEATHISQVYVKRFKAKEVEPVMYDGEFHFPLAEGDLSQPGLKAHEVRKLERKKRIREEKAEARAQARAEEAAKEQEEIEKQEQQAQQDLPTEERDYWTCSEERLIRHHKQPRNTLYVPSDEDSPIPLKYLDVQRLTQTNADHLKDKEIRDIWTEQGNKALDVPWTGRTLFTILKKQARPGYYWVMGRETRKKKTTRPDSLWPEMWRGLSEKEKQKAKDDWEKEKGPLQDARQKRGIYEILPEDEEHFLHVLSEAKKNHSIPEAPSMPTIPMSLIAMRMRDSEQEFVQAISYLEQCITPATATKSSASNATPSASMENEPGL